MRRPKFRNVRNILIAIAVLATVSYGADGLYLHYRGNPYADVRVDKVYAMTNRYNVVEYSVSPPGVQRCMQSLFPHDGNPPCWYLNRHTMNFIRFG
jgi:hypothetical protein